MTSVKYSNLQSVLLDQMDGKEQINVGLSMCLYIYYFPMFRCDANHLTSYLRHVILLPATKQATLCEIYEKIPSRPVLNF